MAPELLPGALRISIADLIALRVRTRGPEGDAAPQFLYQALPISAMPLMATLPSGISAVSIPHLSGLGNGYPILKSPHESSDGFVIVYARQSSGSYDARNVLFQGRPFEINAFRETASHWVNQQKGCVETIPGRYSYFVPTQDMWGVILGDSGYIAVEPSKIPMEATPGLKGSLQNCGMIARVAVQKGDKQPPGATLPVFARVEVMFDSDPGSQSRWISFDDYQNTRALLARPPFPIIADFNEWMKRLAAESGFEHWVFRPGMLFGDRSEWWSEGCLRRTEHEGVDFAEGLKPKAEICRIPEGTPVRAIADGEVVAFLDDFLNKTIVVRHPGIAEENGRSFFTLYSHIHPMIGSANPVKKGQIIGEVGKSTNAKAPVHLHLTGAWIPQTISAENIRMDHIHPAFVPVVLTNFNGLLSR
jgi:hypothetical protein